MCKICVDCRGIMNYDPYFQADVCSKCGKREKRNAPEIEKRNEHRQLVYEASLRTVSVLTGRY